MLAYIDSMDKEMQNRMVVEKQQFVLKMSLRDRHIYYYWLRIK